MPRPSTHTPAALSCLAVIALGCSSGATIGDPGPGTPTARDGGIVLPPPGAGGSPSTQVLGSGTCSGTAIQCDIPKCANEEVGTTISGKVWDPAGKNPLNGAVVYIPGKPDEIAPLAPGLSGSSCGTCVPPTGSPIAGAVTNPDGSFVIPRAPVGTQLPLVVQIGKWRRMTQIDVKNRCADNPLSDVNLTRLPRSQSDGLKASIPRIAMVAGGADRLQCLLTRLGLDGSEFTPPSGSGRVHLFNLPGVLNDPSYSGKFDSSVHAGATFPVASTDLWNSLNTLSKYDIVLLACGGAQSKFDPLKTNPNAITDEAKQNLRSYLGYGGRVFAEHYHWSWIKSFPSSKTSEPGIPSPLGTDIASWIPYDSDNTISSAPALVDQSFPKGRDFARWLVSVGASNALGTITFDPADKTTKPSAKDEAPGAPSARRWIYQPEDSANPTGPAAFTHYLSFNVSSGAATVVDKADTTNQNICGRFVYTGLHVAAASSSAHPPDGTGSFPTQCQAGDLSSYEKAIEFMLFDLSSCLTLDTATTKQVLIF